MLPGASRYGRLDLPRAVNWDCQLTRRVRLWVHYGLWPAGGTDGVQHHDLTGYRWGQGRQNQEPVSLTRKGGRLAYPTVMALTAGTSQRVDFPYQFGITSYTVDDILTNAAAVTVLLVYRKTDTTGRQTQAFGPSAEGGSLQHRASAHLPWDDGSLYWDFGGVTGGTSRLSAAWSADTDWHWWAFVAGDGQGMRVYQDGRLFASQAGSTTRTTGGGGTFRVGSGGFAGCDNAELSELVVLDRGLSRPEVVEWMRQSQAGHPNTLNWQRPNFGLVYRGTQAAPPPGGVLGSVFGGNIIRSG